MLDKLTAKFTDGTTDQTRRRILQSTAIAGAGLTTGFLSPADDTSDSESHAPDNTPFKFETCDTVEARHHFENVMVSIRWWSDDGLLNTFHKSIGPVDSGDRIDATDIFDGTALDFDYGPLITKIEGYYPQNDTTVAPGNGDVTVENPSPELCEVKVLSGYTGKRHPQDGTLPGEPTGK